MAPSKRIDPQKTISVNDAAEVMQIERSTAIRMIHAGEISGYKPTPGKTAPFRVYAQSVIDYCARIQYRDVADQVRKVIASS